MVGFFARLICLVYSFCIPILFLLLFPNHPVVLGPRFEETAPRVSSSSSSSPPPLPPQSCAVHGSSFACFSFLVRVAAGGVLPLRQPAPHAGRQLQGQRRPPSAELRRRSSPVAGPLLSLHPLSALGLQAVCIVAVGMSLSSCSSPVAFT